MRDWPMVDSFESRYDMGCAMGLSADQLASTPSEVTPRPKDASGVRSVASTVAAASTVATKKGGNINSKDEERKKKIGAIVLDQALPAVGTDLDHTPFPLVSALQPAATPSEVKSMATQDTIIDVAPSPTTPASVKEREPFRGPPEGAPLADGDICMASASADAAMKEYTSFPSSQAQVTSKNINSQAPQLPLAPTPYNTRANTTQTDEIFTPASINTFHVVGQQDNVARLITMMGGHITPLKVAQFVVLPLRVNDSICLLEHDALVNREGVHPLARVVSREWVTECWSQGHLVDPAPYIMSPFLEEWRTRPRVALSPRTTIRPPLKTEGTWDPVVAAFVAATGPVHGHDSSSLRSNSAAQSMVDKEKNMPQHKAHRATSTPCPSPRDKKRKRNEPLVPSSPECDDNGIEAEHDAKNDATQTRTSTPALTPSVSGSCSPQPTSQSVITPATDAAPQKTCVDLKSIPPDNREVVQFLISSLRSWVKSDSTISKTAFLTNLPSKGMKMAPKTAYNKYKKFVDREIPEMQGKNGTGKQKAVAPVKGHVAKKAKRS